MVAAWRGGGKKHGCFIDESKPEQHGRDDAIIL
jgi:hypothetical protein